MRNSTNFAVLVAVGASIAFVGCSSSDTSAPATGGTSSHAGSGGSAVSAAGSSGASTVAGSGGSGAAAGTSAGGTAAAGGSAGGASAGSGGANAGSGGALAGSGGSAAGGSGVTCADEAVGVGTGAGVTTAVVLIDNVVVTKGATSAVQWQFADDKQIKDVGAGDTPPADMWARVNYADPNRVSASDSAHDTFIACAGNPAGGSLKNVIPFTADSQYYQVRVVGAPLDLTGGATITASVKLVGGGRPVPACAAGAFLYAIDNTAGASTHKDADPFTPLKAGVWTPITLTVPAAGFSKVGQVAVQISTYSCGAGM